MTKQELQTNIKNLENTIKANCWNAGYVRNSEITLNIYKQALKELNIIPQLEKLAIKSNERTQRTIKNLIGRINHFESIGDNNKLDECIAEAELFLN